MARMCGYCYERGHNRRTCPSVKKQIKANPEGYLARTEARKKARQVARGPRKCGWCNETGHNKRSCQKLAEDRRDHKKQIREWRTQFLTIAKDKGFGVGALLKIHGHLDENSDDNWHRNRMAELVKTQGEYGVVVGLIPKALDKRQRDRGSATVQVRFPSGNTINTLLPDEFQDLLNKHSKAGMKIVGTIDATKIQDFFNRSWHQGDDTVDWHLGLN